MVGLFAPSATNRSQKKGKQGMSGKRAMRCPFYELSYEMDAGRSLELEFACELEFR